MTNKTAEAVSGWSIMLAIIGFVVMLAWRFLAVGFWSAIGAAFIYTICSGIVVGIICLHCYHNTTKKKDERK